MPKLSYEQRNLRSVRLSGQMGCAVGLTVGCVIGMFPLLFFSSDKEKEVDNSAAEAEANNKLINYQTMNVYGRRNKKVEGETYRNC